MRSPLCFPYSCSNAVDCISKSYIAENSVPARLLKIYKVLILHFGGSCSKIVLVIAVQDAKRSDSNPAKHLSTYCIWPMCIFFL